LACGSQRQYELTVHGLLCFALPLLFNPLSLLRDFLEATSGNKVLIIQADFEDGSQNAQLVASAK